MPCFIAIAALLGLTLPAEAKFREWLERKLMERLKVKKHRDLKRRLEAAYEEDPYELKLLIQTLIAEYKKGQVPYEATRLLRRRRDLEITGVV